jgi:hypothetical protein
VLVSLLAGAPFETAQLLNANQNRSLLLHCQSFENCTKTWWVILNIAFQGQDVYLGLSMPSERWIAGQTLREQGKFWFFKAQLPIFYFSMSPITNWNPDAIIWDAQAFLLERTR